jgi:2'-5' RNA ligase
MLACGTVATATLVALDIAILPPADVMARAIRLSAGLSAHGSAAGSRSLEAADADILRLDDAHLPHITLTQHYVREPDLELTFGRVSEVLERQPPLQIHVTGITRNRRTVWMSVTRTPDLLHLHRRLMAALRGIERQDGGPRAFYDGNGRPRDVQWVARFRRQASDGAFTPHITLGYIGLLGDATPAIEPLSFEATSVAACHLGRFCTCRRVLRAWQLKSA